MSNDFENLNMTNLCDVLCQIFFGGNEDYKKYIVPLQGNWYNPTQKYGVDNWIGYVIDSVKTGESIVNDWDNGNRYLRTCQSVIHLTFIGADAEEMAQSVLFWNARSDVKKVFDEKYKGVLCNKDFVLYSAYYEQEGLNSTLCWNIEFSLRHNLLLTAESPVLRHAELGGNLIIGG